MQQYFQTLGKGVPTNSHDSFSGQTSFVKMKSLATALYTNFVTNSSKIWHLWTNFTTFFWQSLKRNHKNFAFLGHKLPKVPLLDHNYQDELPYESQNCYKHPIQEQKFENILAREQTPPVEQNFFPPVFVPWLANVPLKRRGNL